MASQLVSVDAETARASNAEDDLSYYTRRVLEERELAEHASPDLRTKLFFGSIKVI